jgi:uncharacterized membrane protein YeaQ/YmgE (transglycosylase-associated protein family)
MRATQMRSSADHRSAAAFLRALLFGSYPNHTFDDDTDFMGIFGYIISLVIVGFIIGGLGRLIVPGPNPIGAWRTLGVGLVGALVGSLIGGLLGIGIVTIIFEVMISAGLVYLVSGRSRRLTVGGRR